MESGLINDDQITASSEFDERHAAFHGRLNFKEGKGKVGGWSAATNDDSQWLQIAFPQLHKNNRFRDTRTKFTRIRTVGNQIRTAVQ